MFKRFSISFLVVIALGASAIADTWNIDMAHSNVGFAVRHMVISKVRGTFADFSGTVEFDGKNFDKASVQATVQIASVDTDNEKRDGHLRTSDFFDAEKFPTMSFQSTKIVPGKDGEFKMIGNLTIKDVTKEVTFDCEFAGVVDAGENTRAGFSAETTINRQDFNVAWENKLQDGSLIVGNDVDITIEVEAIKAK